MVLCVAVAMALLIPLVFFLLPEWPADVGALPYGADPGHPVEVRSSGNPLKTAFAALGEGARSRDFWLLAITFAVCGFTTNGLVGTHMIALCHDHGLEAVTAGGLLAMMGAFDLVGTTASGWLTDRVDPRKLLFAYYGLRGLSLIYLPFASFTFYGLSWFAVFYGLDWIATVPPTLAIRQQGVRSGQGSDHVRLDFRQPSDRRRRRDPVRRPVAHRHRLLSRVLRHRRIRGGGGRFLALSIRMTDRQPALA